MTEQTKVLISPQQAGRIHNAAAPRQRNVFIVQFSLGTAAAGKLNADELTFVVKSTDRPKISIKHEELNQYNKKRIVYTGFKYEPVKMTFYDDAKGRAQGLWDAYSRHYFGDFGGDLLRNGQAAYDVTTEKMFSGYGLTENYSGVKSDDNTGQWFFTQIKICHLYVAGSQQLFDSYELNNPRITSYDPDEFDYEASAVAQVSMTFAYENLQYNRGQAVTNDVFPEFKGLFFTPQVATQPTTTSNVPSPISNTPSAAPVAFSFNSLTSGALAPITNTAEAAYRSITAPSTTSGPLSQYGNLSFGTPGEDAAVSANSPAAVLATANPNLTITLPTSSNLTMPNTQIGTDLQSAVLQSGQMTNQSQGGSLPSSAYAAYNANQTGTSQIGFMSNVTSDSQNLGPAPFGL